MLHLVSDLDHTLQLAVQALRPGGLLISKTPCIAEMNPLIPWLAIPLMRAIGKAPAVLSFEGPGLHAAIARQGMDIVSVERHGTRGKDIRLFIVARKPPEFPHSPSRLLPRPGAAVPTISSTAAIRESAAPRASDAWAFTLGMRCLPCCALRDSTLMGRQELRALLPGADGHAQGGGHRDTELAAPRFEVAPGRGIVAFIPGEGGDQQVGQVHERIEGAALAHRPIHKHRMRIGRGARALGGRARAGAREFKQCGDHGSAAAVAS
jgi:hypothetical protein